MVSAILFDFNGVLIDDEPLLLSALKRLLMTDFELGTAGGGAEAATTPLTITRPVIISASALPRSDWMNRARPMVPAAPGTLSTCTLAAGSSAFSTRCMARAV